MTSPNRDELLPLTRGAAVAGVQPETLRRRVDSGEIPAWADPADKRVVLVRLTDVERLRERVLVPIVAPLGGIGTEGAPRV